TEYLIRLKAEEQKKMLEDLHKKGNNKCKIDSLKTENVLDREKPLTSTYAISIPDYVTSIDDEIFVNFWLSKRYLGSRIDTAGRGIIPREVDFTFQDRHHYVLEIPEGYRLRDGQLPEA